jgi:hypothetical protein
VLPSSSSLNEKEVLIYLDGGGIEGSGSSFLRYFKAALMVALEHNTCFHLTIHLDNPLTSALNQSYESFYSFGPSKEFPNTRCIMFWSTLSLCCQVLCLCLSVQGKSSPQKSAIYNVTSSHTRVSPFSSTISYHFPVTSFMSIDGGYINALLRRVFSCRLQQIIQEIDLGTHQYLGTFMPQWQASSHSTVGMHQ